MRIWISCLVLLLVPPLVIIGIKQYHRIHDSAAFDEQAHWNKRGEVYFFNASWCGPCRQMKPIVSELRRKGFHLRDVDVDRNQALAAKYGIRAVPTFVFVENGAEVHRFSGGTSADELRKLCDHPAYR